jgi:hypothetical protein
MKNRQRRLKAIELSLTPQQVVVLWLRDAVQAGTFEEGARHSPPYRGTVANAVFRTVRESMKGQPEPLIERAILQARQEADLLYSLAVNANVEVFENRDQREREYILLLGYLGAELRGESTKDSVERLRMGVRVFIDAVIVMDAAISQVAAERFNGQQVLFRDCEVKLKEQLQMADRLSGLFNFLARAAGATEINLEEHRNSLQSETDCHVSIWVNLARVAALGTFGTEEQMHAAMDQYALLFEPRSGKPLTREAKENTDSVESTRRRSRSQENPLWKR